MVKRLFLFASIATLLVLALLLTAAPTVMAQSENVPTVNTSDIRVVNGLVGIGPVDVYLDNTLIAYGLQPEAATPYFHVPSGKHSIAVRPVNTDPLSAPIADTLLDLAPNESETAIAYQKQFASPEFRPAIQGSGAFFIVNDDRSPIHLGNTRLTGVHLAVGNPGRLSIGYPSKESLLHQIALEQPFGTIDIVADRAYSLNVIDGDNPNMDILERFGEYNFYANTLYTLIIVPNLIPEVGNDGQFSYRVGNPSSEPHMFVISGPIDPPSENGIRLRIAHAAHSTAVLDIYVDEKLVASRVNYSRITEYLGLESYSHTISLRRFGASPTSPPLAQANFNITRDNQSQQTWTLLLLNANDTNVAALDVIQPGSEETSSIINTPGGNMVMALLPDDISQTRRGFARIRLIDAADGVPSLRLTTPAYPLPDRPFGLIPTATPTPTAPIPPIQLIDSVLFGAEAGTIEVPAGLYASLSIIPGGSNQPLVDVNNIRLVGGVVYTFLVMGSPLGNPAISYVMLEDYGIGIPLTRLYLGTVTAASANVRVNPSASSRVLTLLPRGSEVEVLGRTFNGDWVRVRYTNPESQIVEEGWISGTSNILAVTRLGVPVNILSLPVYSPPATPTP
jgi:hypothetical protein